MQTFCVKKVCVKKSKNLVLKTLHVKKSKNFALQKSKNFVLKNLC